MAQLNVDQLIKDLTTLEKISLLAGEDWWHTVPIPRLGIPSIRVSDGPNGVRGTRFFNGVKSGCFPCGTALGATWNTEILEEAGNFMAEEAKAKGAQVILGPNVNMQRGPLGGRGFESFSEDPLLSGNCAAAVINGMQSNKIAATIKHYTGNDQEHERMAANSVISNRALREIYLLPFQIAVRDSQPAAFMTAYNKVNGPPASESPFLLQDILRGEWGWSGLVMSDWYGTYSTSGAVNDGLDLEMPGPTRRRGDILNHAILTKNVIMKTLNERVKAVVNLINWTKDAHIADRAPETTDNNTQETSAFMRKLASEAVVLMKNENNILPLKKNKVTAIIGPGAKTAIYCGGGSAELPAYYTVTPFDGFSQILDEKNIKYCKGADDHKALPSLKMTTTDGQPGFVFKAYNEPPSVPGRASVDRVVLTNTNIFLADYVNPEIKNPLFYAILEGGFTAEHTGEFKFGLSVYGTAKLFVDGELVIDNETAQRSGDFFMGSGTIEETGIRKVEAGQKYSIKVEFASAPATKIKKDVIAFGGGGVRIGGTPVIDPKEEIEKAVLAAKSADQVILCVGRNSDWESEGHDRETMALPLNLDDLVTAVIEANSNTVVVVQAGTPISMPWLSSANALVHAWYGGNETGNAIADVVFGLVNPSAKLPLTFPVTVEDNPTFLNFRSERGRVFYDEDIYIGYRYYERLRKAVAFPFGHGLSYTSFAFSNLEVSVDEEKDDLLVSVTLSNTGSCDGAEVVQVYIQHISPAISRPVKELKGFKKVTLKKGEHCKVNVSV